MFGPSENRENRGRAEGPVVSGDRQAQQGAGKSAQRVEQRVDRQQDEIPRSGVRDRGENA